MTTRNRLLKILAVASAVMIAVFFVAEIYALTTRNYSTRTVYEQTVLETVDSEMFIVRDETLLNSNASGTFVQIADNGERVSRGSTIAAFFNNETAAHNYVKIESLNSLLAVYQSIQGQTRLENVDIEKLQNQTKSDFDNILESVYNNDYSEFDELKLSYNESASKRQKALGQDVDCSEKIDGIMKEISILQKNVTPGSIITAENSGYYVGEADGYESVLTVADLETLTEKDYDSALKAKRASIPENSIGKIINGYNWYIVTSIDSAKAVGMDKGDSVKIILGDSSDDAVQTTIYSTKTGKDNKTLIVFRCNLMNDRLASLRKVSGKVVIAEHKGFKISKEAVRFDEEGNAGVYIRRANIVNFRSLNIIYSEESFVVAADSQEFKSEYPHIKLYDEVIISGKELSNGMVIG